MRNLLSWLGLSATGVALPSVHTKPKTRGHGQARLTSTGYKRLTRFFVRNGEYNLLDELLRLSGRPPRQRRETY